MSEPGKTDVFLTHDWGKDELGRSNHDRVAVVNEALKELGYKTWFDSDRMTGDILNQMASGIDNTKVILVFVTQRYALKVGGTNGADNCKLEFQHAARMKTKNLMVPIIMENRMKSPSAWKGPVGIILGGELAVRMSFEFSDCERFKAGIAELKQEIDVRLRSLEAAVPDISAASITAPVATPAPAPAPAATPTRAKVAETTNYTEIYYALLHSAGENLKIKKIDGHGAGKYLYLRKNHQIDLTNDKEKANNWSVKPKRQYGKLGFSLMLFKRLDGQESSPSLIVDENSSCVVLNNGSYENEEGDFWAIIPKREDNKKSGNFKTFQIVNMKSSGPLLADWSKRGSYKIRCHETGIGSTTLKREKVKDSLWEFEGSMLLKAFPGQKEFSNIYDQSILNEKSLLIKNLGSDYLGHDNKTGKVFLSNRANSSWGLSPWQETSKSCVMITPSTGKFQLAVDTDGESVILSEGVMSDAGFQDNKWGLVPVEELEIRGVYIIRKCMGNNAGAKLAVENSSGKIVCTNSKDSGYSFKWKLVSHP